MLTISHLYLTHKPSPYFSYLNLRKTWKSRPSAPSHKKVYILNCGLFYCQQWSPWPLPPHFSILRDVICLDSSPNGLRYKHRILVVYWSLRNFYTFIFWQVLCSCCFLRAHLSFSRHLLCMSSISDLFLHLAIQHVAPPDALQGGPWHNLSHGVSLGLPLKIILGFLVSYRQTCKKLGTWEPSSRTFLEKNPDIFQKSKIFILS